MRLRLFLSFRDRGATLRLEGTVKDSILGGGEGCTKRFFLLTHNNFKNIWGARAPPCPPAPRSLFLIRKGEPGWQTKFFEKHRLTNFKPGAKEIRGFFSTSDELCKFVFWHVTANTKHSHGVERGFFTIGEPVSFLKPLIWSISDA